MTTQITVRLPDDLVSYLDDLVRERSVPSRTAAVARALSRDRRRLLAERDARILAAIGEDDDPDDLEGLARHAARTALDVD